MIKVEDVHFHYPNGQTVLEGINCHIKPGEKVALIGPNGAGKSTFMSLLNGVSLPKQGNIEIAGIPLNKATLKQVRRKIGIVFQDPDDQLFCPTVFDDVAFGPLNLGLSEEEIHHRVDEALSLVGLKGYESRISFHLSFGEKKRLALATVLSYQPDILVFDEPSTNMDPLNRRRLINWLKESDKTILLCTHDLDIALEICNRCLLLDQGKISVQGKTQDILNNKELLEQHHLELPLALMTHELLQDILQKINMDAEHRKIIGGFLHAHRHVHGSNEHIHFHAHPHDEDHVHEPVDDQHIHESLAHQHEHEDSHDALHEMNIPHSHDDDHQHDVKKPEEET